MPNRKPNPDNILAARLDGTALRLAREGGSIRDSVAELRDLANGRRDLLTQTAGIMGGSWSADPIRGGDHLIAAGMLINAGAVIPELEPWIKLGRERASQPHSSGPPW